ncbi:MAG: recombinase family protein, partial [Burkholderiales bacterium]|nr:recombinase family protein [Burkholderiales bacterium]
MAVYARVSTAKQADADLSIPDQLSSARMYCERRGWTIVAEFVEPGASGTDDSRPEFQRLMEAATSRPRPYDVVLVHSLSRFARELVTVELSAKRLAKVGARLVSMTQETSNDENGDLMRRIIAAIDEHHSRENAKHTLRAMRENARQGYWNGARPPFGYRVIEAGQRGHRMKKVLAVEEPEAALVRRIFAMHLGAEGAPLGVKAIAAKLNREGLRFRGKPFSISSVHRILSAETYAGRHWFNRVSARSGQSKARDEWVEVRVPSIVSAEDHARVQESLAARAPDRSPPRLTTSPVLLTGIAVCETCGAGMTLRTGKSNRYRYYTCAARAHRGETVCPGRSVPMEQLDQAVTNAFAELVLRPDRMEQLLAAYLARSAEADSGRRERIARVRKELTEAGGAKANLLKLVSTGALDAADPDLVTELRAADARRRQAEEDLALLEAAAAAAGPKVITPRKVERLAEAIRAALRT